MEAKRAEDGCKLYFGSWKKKNYIKAVFNSYLCEGNTVGIRFNGKLGKRRRSRFSEYFRYSESSSFNK